MPLIALPTQEQHDEELRKLTATLAILQLTLDHLTRDWARFVSRAHPHVDTDTIRRRSS